MILPLLGLLLTAIPLIAQERILWRDPGRVETIDFTYAPGGPGRVPQPPFFLEREDMGGTSPKVITRDARGERWRVKGGLEVRAETFVTRLVAALGYYAEITYFIPRGRIENAGTLKRASGFLKADGSFTYASFEWIDPNLKYLADDGWGWRDNPFIGTHELNGLKILVMLVSNWDNKDQRDRSKGSNTGIFERISKDKSKIYFVNDWGQSLGAWGKPFFSSPVIWDCERFRRQTPEFIKGVSGRMVLFGFEGQHTADFKSGIGVEDVRWLLRYLGRVTDAQIRTGLLASGAEKHEEECLAQSLRERIERLKKAAAGSS